MRKFELGQLMATRGVADKMDQDNKFAEFVWGAYLRYIACDWGDVSADDRKINNHAVKNDENERILGAYIQPETGIKIWFITEWDRSVTTILFSDEY